MWQHKSVHDRLDELEDKLSSFFRGTPASGGADHQILHLLKHMEIRLMASIDDLKAAVARETAVEDSVVTLLAGISQQLKDLKGNPPPSGGIDPAALDAIIADLDANTSKLSAAVTANT